MPSPGERGDRKAVGEEWRQKQHRTRPDGSYDLADFCPHSSSVKNQRFLPPSPRGKAFISYHRCGRKTRMPFTESGKCGMISKTVR